MVVYDVQGKRVKTLVNGSLASGNHTVRWDGRDEAGSRVADGVYFCHVKAGTAEETAKMLLMK
jgi:flagellar hook assembly protein FlgD